jgi:hypothetical protein
VIPPTSGPELPDSGLPGAGRTRPTIGWYVHHHGRGHLTRFLAIRARLDADVVCFSTLAVPDDLPAGTTWIRLERDDVAERGVDGREQDPALSDPTVSGLLHWAPLGHHGQRSRLGRIAVEALRQHLAAFVVDVSVEVTLFVRLLGIPVIAVAQPGRRDDGPHLLGYRAATRILAPWPRGAVDAPAFDTDLPDDAADVVFTGGISRFDGREPALPPAARTGALVLLGSGGGAVDDDRLAELEAAVPSRLVTVLAPGRDWIADPWTALTSAAVVVAWAGQNTVADLAAAGAKAVVIPQERPFDEQATAARALDRLGLAAVEESWPEAWRWPSVLDRATALEPDWSIWGTAGAAARAAAAIEDVASQWRG